MGVGVSLILIAAGAVMAWAVTASTHGFNIHTVFGSSWAGPGYFSRRRTVTDAGPAGRRTVVEDDVGY